MLSEQVRNLLVVEEQKEKPRSRKVLYLSGLMGSGKTAIVETLGREGYIAKVVPEFLDPIPDFVMDTRPSSPIEEKIAAQLWILEQYEKKNILVKDIRDNVVVDRTWIDCLTYSVIYGPETTGVITAKIAETDWVPGKYIIVYADPRAVKDRLMGNFQLSEEQWDSSWSPYVDALHDTVLEILSHGYGVGIDTTNLSIEQATQRVVQEI